MSGAVVSGLSCYGYCVEAFVSGAVVSGAVVSGAVVLWLLCRGVRVRGCGVGGCRVGIDCVECHDVGACGVESVVRGRAMGRVHWVVSFGGMSGCYGVSIERCSSETGYGGDV